MAENMISLLSLEDDLTCSICLCPFENPVSLICGHSFCANCLEMTWSEGSSSSLSCPQCRMQFSTKPDLKKNTVLTAVVEAFKTRSGDCESINEPVEMKKKDSEPIKCDTCMKAIAVKTCLTCMASFCEDHVRPHLENAIFRAHQLCDPLRDLMERLCPDHGKLMEFYCTQHQCCICSNCLQYGHKGCHFLTTAEHRSVKQNDLHAKLTTLEGKTEKHHQVIVQMKDQQNKLKELAATRKRILEAEFKQIREMIDRDEKAAMCAIDKEQEKGQSKLASLIKKFDENIEKMDRTKSEIAVLLDQSESLAFLKASVDLPSVVNFEPRNPRINVDSKEVIAYHSSAVALKEWITKLLEQSPENRIPVLKPGNQPSGISDSFTTSPVPREMSYPLGFPFPMNLGPPSPGASFRGRGQGAPLKARAPGTKQKNPPQKYQGNKEHRDQKDHKDKDHKERKDQRGNRPKNPTQGMNPTFSKSLENLNLNLSTKGADLRELSQLPSSSVADNHVKRSDLLKYATILNFDVRTAHKRISLSDNDTKATVSDEPCNYSDIPTRFSVCSQVLCTKGFSQGRHYWEIKMSSNNFCGLGLAYGRIDRKGPSSRLGRNAESWCVEWFNVKLSAWHNSIETVLANPNPSRVGVLLDCDEGSVTFYNVQDRAYPFHTFVFPFLEPVYPAFWIFSNSSSISLCKLSN